MLSSLRLAVAARSPPGVAGALAVVAAGAVLGLAAQHPLSPPLALAGGAAVAALVWWRPHTWLFGLPALLPVLSWSPWSGWWLLDESDLLVLAVLAGGYARVAGARRSDAHRCGKDLSDAPATRASKAVASESGSGEAGAREPGAPVTRASAAGASEAGAPVTRASKAGAHAAGQPVSGARGLGAGAAGAPAAPALAPLPRRWREAQSLPLLVLALLVTLLLGTLRGLADAGWPVAFEGALYAGHDSAWNTLRVAKSLLWALLLLPLLRQALQAGQRPLLARGMLAGLLLVSALVLWERHTYAALFDFSDSYRTSAAFWEMHVGGGAIDAYLALALPFAAWALWAAPTRLRALAALFALGLGLYAVLTTYSRGVVLAVWLALLAMVVLALRHRLMPRAPGVARQGAALAVLLLLAGEAAVVLTGGAMLPRRLTQSGDDLLGRVAHWRAGLALLDGPGDWLLGLGLGRLPAHYSRRVPGGEWPGQAVWSTDAQGRGQLLLSSPASRAERAAGFGLTQRVSLQPGGVYALRWRASPVAAGQPRLLFSLCERHLLYSARCQRATVTPTPTDQAQWVRLDGPGFGRRGGVLSVSVLGRAQSLRLHTVELLDPQGRQRLHNPDFQAQLQHWWPSAQGHFQPWHIDNLYLELLIERGLLGLAVFGAWLAWAARGLLRSLREPPGAVEVGEWRMAWVLSAALLGVLLLGAVVSLMDNPRVALLAMLCLWASEPKTKLNCANLAGNEK